MIELGRRDGRPLRIGHRGAAALASENTLEAFRAALETGVDLIEFDVLDLRSGELVIAHSNDLEEVSHGAARGTVRDKSLAELRELSPELPTLDEALRFFAEDAPETGIHLDLKAAGRERDIVAALERLKLEDRALVTSLFARTPRAVAAASRSVRPGITIPRKFLGLSDSGRGAPVARVGLHAVRGVAPLLVGRLLSFTRANVLAIHHSVVTAASVRAAHAHGAAVIAWTVDDPEELRRMDEAGVNAVVSNDPRIFSTLRT